VPAAIKARLDESARVTGARDFPAPRTIYDPVARVLDAVGDRWSLALVRQLLTGPKGFQELRQRTGIAPRVLSARLKELAELGFVGQPNERAYCLTELGETLEPIVASLARWFTRHGMKALQLDAGQFNETTPQSILESLPFLVREDRAQGAHAVFEIRLSGEGGGVWSVHIEDGRCHVSEGFAENADARYTAPARVWCGVALGLARAKDMVARGLLSKEGKGAMDYYFHQISHEAPEKKSPAERGKQGRQRRKP